MSKLKMLTTVDGFVGRADGAMSRGPLLGVSSSPQ